MSSSTVVLRPTRAKAARLVATSLALTACSALMALTSDELVLRAVGYVGSAFFGLGTAAAVASAVGSAGYPRVTIDEQGLEQRSWTGTVSVPRSAVDEVRVISMFGNRMVSLSLRDPAVLDAQRGALQRWLGRTFRGFGDITIADTTYSESCDQIADLIRERIRMPG